MTEAIQYMRKVDAGRAETGVIQFGDDWPGIFIRGDNACAFAMYLRSVLDGHDPGGIYTRALGRFADLLESCRV